MTPSKLNPHATPYVPLAKRGDDMYFSPSVQSDSSKSPMGIDSPKTTEHHPNEVGYLSGLYCSSSHNYEPVEESQFGAEKLEMELQYLQRTFPGVSEQSVTDVYFFSGCDLEGALDMLNHLENLPDSLDIGDVSEPQISSELSNLKVKEVADEASSASAESPVATATS